MTSHVHEFDAREGGAFRISLMQNAATAAGWKYRGQVEMAERGVSAGRSCARPWSMSGYSPCSPKDPRAGRIFCPLCPRRRKDLPA
jgi:hypothetical protein